VPPRRRSVVDFNFTLTRRTALEKFGVDEGASEELEKKASENCPKCGSKVEVHGKTLVCPRCGSEPFEPAGK